VVGLLCRGADTLSAGWWFAEYMGGAVTCDAHHMTDPRADGLGVSTCIELALKDAGVEKEQVNYINAHATR
jgi:3-oxoacyl-[acyl-carrier-protein] synthase II